MRAVSYEILIHAPAETIYHHLTDPAALLDLQPPHRLIFSYGWEDDLMGVAPESAFVQIDLRAHPLGTLLTLNHRLLPDTATEQHRRGWAHFLRHLAAQLVQNLERGTPT